MTGRKSTSFWSSLSELYDVLEPGRRRQIWVFAFLTVAGAFSEVVTIGAVVPFLAVLANARGIPHLGWIEAAFGMVGAGTRGQQLVAATLLLCVAAIAAGIIRILLVRKTQDFVFIFGHQLSVEVQRRMLLQPYSWHVRHNSSKQIASIEKVEVVTTAVLLPLMQALAATILVGVMAIVLLSIAPLATLGAGVALAAIYYALGAFARYRLEAYSSRIDSAFEKRIRIVQEGLGGIRDVILDGSQAKVVDQFRTVDFDLARARADAVFISTVPRFLIEPAGIIIIAGLALFLSGRSGGLVAALPILGAIALGAQRLLPLVQQLYHGWSLVASNRHVIEDVVGSLRMRIPPSAPPTVRLPFTSSIEFRDVAFTYADRTHPAVSGISFHLRPGSRLALVGPTGSGKSTTADLLMGLLEPSDGEILIDGVPLTDSNRQAWRANVAHVPQMLFVADATIAQNVALTAELEMERVREAASLAQLDDFIQSLPNGYETRVGERGAQISGGQRQRLAIARAIYKDAPLLVLDEATSALDDATEKAVLAALDALQKQGRTIVIIAHRSTTTERCDEIVRLESGRLAEFALRA